MDLLTAVVGALSELGRSDLTGPPPPWLGWLTVQLAHGAVGALAAAYAPRALGLLFLGWVAKEITFDLPGASWSVVVVADSLTDLAAAAVGAWLVLRRRRAGLTR